MNDFQILYLIALVGAFAAYKPHFAMWAVLANAVATLAVCGAMDLGWSNGCPVWFLLIDSITAAVLFTRSGFPMALGAVFSISAVAHMLMPWAGIHRDTTCAIVYGLNAVQVGMLWVGSSGGGFRRRNRFVPSFRRSQEMAGNQGLVARGVAKAGVGDAGR